MPYWIGGLVVALVVMSYVFFGGMRGTAWVNTLQTLMFLVFGTIAFVDHRARHRRVREHRAADGGYAEGEAACGTTQVAATAPTTQPTQAAAARPARRRPTARC